MMAGLWYRSLRMRVQNRAFFVPLLSGKTHSEYRQREIVRKRTNGRQQSPTKKKQDIRPPNIQKKQTRLPESVLKQRIKLSENEKILILFRQKMRCNTCSDLLVVHPDTKRKLFDFDHIIPRRKNGETSVRNMQALCPKCHAIKTSWDMYK
jgi:5-methylcytosine-specific restriction endonuclease McrA